MNRKSVAFHTLGCKVNYDDSESMWQIFARAGYRQVDFSDPADVYIINTCTVTNEGDRKSRQMIHRAVKNNPDAVVVVTGCYAQVAPDDVLALDGVDLVIGNHGRDRLLELIQIVEEDRRPHRFVQDIIPEREFEDLEVGAYADRKRASLKIEDGCDHFCTFCIIPYARGLVRSRKPERVMQQAKRLVASGHQEIILTGIHTGGYGQDLDHYTLADLLVDLEKIDGLHRIRISSIEASEITDSLIAVLTQSQKVCRHLHIPLQSGHDEVLRRMNRHYTTQQYAQKVALVREALPGVAITSDVIVGFPGESEENFAATVEFIRAQKFADLHVFPYSRRSGTPAAKFPDQVSKEVKHARVAHLVSLAEELSFAYAQGWKGRILEVIPEETTVYQGHPYLVGHADNYMKVAFIGDEQLFGKICKVRVKTAGADYSIGALLPGGLLNG